MLGMDTAPRPSGIYPEQTPIVCSWQTDVARELNSAVGGAAWPKALNHRQHSLFSPHYCLGGKQSSWIDCVLAWPRTKRWRLYLALL